MSNIPDELDQMLQGSDQTPASPAQIGGQGDDLTQDNPVGQQTPEEIEFNKLSGSAQERIRKLVQRAREAEEKSQNTFSPPPPPPGFANLQRNPEVDDAVRKLSEVGIATDEKVDKKLSEGLNQMRWEYEQKRLESRYDGSKGEPQYVQEEVEDYIRKHPQYNAYAAEDVFRFKMFPDEFTNLELNKRSSKTGQTSTLRPTKGVQGGDQNSIESLMDRIDPQKHSDALQYYDEHLNEINDAIKSMQ